jgi:hypothetical protein
MPEGYEKCDNCPKSYHWNDDDNLFYDIVSPRYGPMRVCSDCFAMDLEEVDEDEAD